MPPARGVIGHPVRSEESESEAGGLGRGSEGLGHLDEELAVRDGNVAIETDDEFALGSEDAAVAGDTGPAVFFVLQQDHLREFHRDGFVTAVG